MRIPRSLHRRIQGETASGSRRFLLLPALLLVAGAARAEIAPEWTRSVSLGAHLASEISGFVVDSAGNSYVTGSAAAVSGSGTDVRTASFAARCMTGSSVV